jgi:uncharacterized lipoprotein YddW (UPF0748 family)
MRILSLVVMLALPGAAYARQGAPPKHELRGAWIATVLNLDWPARGAAPASQQAALVQMLDGLKAAGINAVFFQIRAEADAFYASSLVPWSYWLTGVQGQAPAPFYDPLAFAVEEAHRRGMELHAWMNPFRASRNADGYPRAPTHVAEQHPEWILSLNNLLVLNPGLQAVRDHITSIIMEVVRGYDIDGVHFDDYFYPYPPNGVSIEDVEDFENDSRGISGIGAWRRDNVNLFVAQVADSLRAEKPWVKFGISPFGIWKDGVPAGTSGLDAYNVINADATAWLDAETIDYLVPQLYWPFGGGQDYALLAPWWAEQANGRHIYIGHGLYRADESTAPDTLLYAPREVPNQIRFNRALEGVQGSVFFRASNLTTLPSQGIVDTLQADLFRYPALVPPMVSKDFFPPGRPLDFEAQVTGAEVTLSWRAPEASGFDPEARRFAVYRVQAGTEPDAGEVLLDARNLLAVTGETTFTDHPPAAAGPYYYFATSVSANAIESQESVIARVEVQAVGVEEVPRFSMTLHPNYPNPFRGGTQLRFDLSRPAVVSLRVYNSLGQLVALLVNRERLPAGPHGVEWDATGLAAGTYFSILEAEGERATQGMVFVQ